MLVPEFSGFKYIKKRNLPEKIKIILLSKAVIQHHSGKKGVLKDWESTCSHSVFLNREAHFRDRCSFSVGGKKTLGLLFSINSNIATYFKWTHNFLILGIQDIQTSSPGSKFLGYSEGVFNFVAGQGWNVYNNAVNGILISNYSWYFINLPKKAWWKWYCNIIVVPWLPQNNRTMEDKYFSFQLYKKLFGCINPLVTDDGLHYQKAFYKAKIVFIHPLSMTVDLSVIIWKIEKNYGIYTKYKKLKENKYLFILKVVFKFL